MAQQEAESSEEEEEEGEAELDSTELHIVEPSLDSAEPEPPVKAAPPDPAPTEADASCEPTGDFPASLQGLGGPGQDEGSSKGPDAHTDPRWLTELLASPRARASGRDPLNTEEQEVRECVAPRHQGLTARCVQRCGCALFGAAELSDELGGG